MIGLRSTAEDVVVLIIRRALPLGLRPKDVDGLYPVESR